MTGLGSSCGACKFLRRKCTNECVFAPHFCYDEAAGHFAAVHKVFGASNVSKLLLHLPIHNRSDAAVTISYEALARIRDPVYGCVAHIFTLQQQVASLQEEIEVLIHQIANHVVEIPSNGNLQAETYLDDKIQLASMDQTMNIIHYQDEQAILADPQGFITGNQIIHTEFREEDSVPPFKWVEHQIFLSDLYRNPLEIDFEGLESGGLIDDPRMGNTGTPSIWE
ncbi:LOB domain-containing protein 14 [Hibiscus syriacus]|uniref:LOB domain-containing protein 14 n=1 Tax=Hibiscus syriacus TaxID=106335 RepID=A0A6A2XXY9_HIBSY|nr:LOB domain-containing protein 29-like [Hibiscus syriacus]KAE8671955.1 LOB domain-containing protein 14 [Hibiscus syriacus]